MVANWAESPSMPMCADFSAELREAFEDDLDTPRAVQVLRRLEKADLPDGSKLETFLWVDGYLGLDLARDIGKAPAALPPGAQELLDARAAARAARDFAASDRLRDELAALGVTVKDTPAGQEWTLA
jgi:cysteinyl-tRNA synthetase